MKKIDFSIVGQAKCGTSALAYFLSQHPDVCMSNPKEPGYFADDIIRESDEFHGKQIYMKTRTKDEYASYYKHCKDGQLCGDATPIYFYSKSAAKNIYKHNPQAKIIIMLRNPVEFMHAMHMQYVNDGSEDVADFGKALQLEPSRAKGKNIPKNAVAPSLLLYKERANYPKQIARYIKHFPKKNILFIDHSDFKNDNEATFRSVLDFLGVEKKAAINFSSVNESSRPRNMAAHKALNNLAFKNSLRKVIGPQRYKQVKNTVAKLLMKKGKRPELDDRTKQALKRQTSTIAAKTDTVTGIAFSKKWGY